MTTPTAPGAAPAQAPASAQAPAQPAKPKHPYARPASAQAPAAAPPAPKHPYAKPAPVTPGAKPARTAIPPKPAPAPAAAKAPSAAPAQPAGPTPRQQAQRERVMAALEAKAARAAAMEAQLAGYAKNEMSKLSERARKFISAQAGKNPEAQLALINQMRETGLLSATGSKPANTEPTKAAAPAPKAAPAAPQANAAALAARYEELKRTSPNAAAQFFLKHSAALARTRSAS